MTYRWFGALLIITGCGSIGFSLAAGDRQRERFLRQLIQVLRSMESELQYRLTPLPELCRQAAKDSSGALQDVFLNLARELDWKAAPDVYSSMEEAMRKSRNLPVTIRQHLKCLSRTLGQYDLPGQLLELQAVRKNCEEELSVLLNGKEGRLRSYQTLGLCAGAALAILLA